MDVSLTDFFYADRQRLHTFLTQLFPEGSLLSSKTLSKKSSSHTGSAAGHVPLVAQFQANGTKSAEDAIERHFDAEWAAPLNFLATVAERGMLNHDLSQSRLGQIVLVRGNLQVLDFATLQTLWRPIQRMILSQAVKDVKATASREQRRSKDLGHRVSEQVKQQREENDAIGDVLDALPPLIQVKCFNDQHSVWGTLKPEFMLSSPAELALKHGRGLPGQWTVVGILDALPHMSNPLPPDGNTEIETGLVSAMDFMKEGLGRRNSHYGITPLLIYRPAHAAHLPLPSESV